MVTSKFNSCQTPKLDLHLCQRPNFDLNSCQTPNFDLNPAKFNPTSISLAPKLNKIKQTYSSVQFSWFQEKKVCLKLTHFQIFQVAKPE